MIWRHSPVTLSWRFPYPSQRMPIFAENVVATSHPLAAQAGLQMMARGGNAVDAALASAMALTVLEPTSNGIGSDAFALVWDGRKLHGLNGSGRSPRAWSPDRFAGLRSMPQRGWDAVTVPGAVDAWASLSERFGSLPFSDLFEPALRYARNGYIVTPFTAGRWALAPSLYRNYRDFTDAFLPGGRAPSTGERFYPRGLYESLLSIAESRGETFYRGSLAERIASQSQSQGGSMTLDDLASHRSDWVSPLSLDWQGVTLHELPPNGQGLTVLIALGILEILGISDCKPHSVDSLHLQIEAMKAAFALSRPHIADPDCMTITPSILLENHLLSETARSIRMDRAAEPRTCLSQEGGTVYVTAADAKGMMVSYIQSNYQGFGSGIVISDTGISLQNRAAGFTLESNHPNRVDGAKRPYHTIIPAFVTRGGAPVMAFGVMGAHMQAQGHLQMMVRIFCWGENPQAAADAPRWYVDEAYCLSLEDGFSTEIRQGLIARGHHLTGIQPPSLFGGAQLALCLDEGYCAASDPRKDGQAVGF